MVYDPYGHSSDPEVLVRVSSRICNEIKRARPLLKKVIRRSKAAIRRSRITLARIERKHPDLLPPK